MTITMQLTVEMAEKVLAALPKTGNGSWVVQQKLLSTRTKEGSVSTTLSEPMIIGPGDKPVGYFVSLSPRAYRPLSTAGYWYIVQMHAAGWVEYDMVDRTTSALLKENE